MNPKNKCVICNEACTTKQYGLFHINLCTKHALKYSEIKIVRSYNSYCQLIKNKSFEKVNQLELIGRKISFEKGGKFE